MATAAHAAPYPHIVKTEGVRGGKARIDGTRICVYDIVYLHKQGMPAEEIREYHSDRPLTLAEVHAALTYYYDHTEEIEEQLERKARFFEDAERRWQELLDRHGGQAPEDPTLEERMIPRPSDSFPK